MNLYIEAFIAVPAAVGLAVIRYNRHSHLRDYRRRCYRLLVQECIPVLVDTQNQQDIFCPWLRESPSIGILVI